MSTMTLTEFLIARIAEDEAVARAASPDGDHIAVWEAGEHESENRRIESAYIDGYEPMIIYDEGGHDEHEAAHIARWDPARILAECETKRRVVARIHLSQMLPVQISDHAAEAILRALALPYADHSDYDQEWKP